MNQTLPAALGVPTQGGSSIPPEQWNPEGTAASTPRVKDTWDGTRHQAPHCSASAGMVCPLSPASFRLSAVPGRYEATGPQFS